MASGARGGRRTLTPSRWEWQCLPRRGQVQPARGKHTGQLDGTCSLPWARFPRLHGEGTVQTTATAVSRSGSSDHSPASQPSPPAPGTPALLLPALPPPCSEPGPRPRACPPPPPSQGHRQPPGTHHSSSAGTLLSGGHRQYVWKAMSHSSHSSCLSGSCLPPHRWQAHMRHGFRSSSLQCLQEGPLFPGRGRMGSARARPRHTGCPARPPQRGGIGTHFLSGFPPWGSPRQGAQS